MSIKNGMSEYPAGTFKGAAGPAKCKSLTKNDVMPIILIDYRLKKCIMRAECPGWITSTAEAGAYIGPVFFEEGS